MKRQLPLCLLLVLVAVPVAAQKVYVDYDSSAAFSQFKTFKIVETRKDFHTRYPQVHNSVAQKLHTYGVEGGMKPADSNPVIYIAYYTSTQGDLRLTLSDLDYTYGEAFAPGTYWDGGVGTRTPHSFVFKEGTLVVDAWEAETNQLIWRGIGTAAVAKDQWEKERGGHIRQLRLYQAQQDG
jgi:hypothetical protein